jgi:hypothetical protein
VEDQKDRRIKNASQHRRQAKYAEQEKELLLEDAKKDAWARFTVIIRKYNIEQDDVEEIMDVSPFLL